MAVLIGAAAVVISRELVSSSDPPKAAPSAMPPKPPDSGRDDFVRFRDAPGAFSISYPSSWQRISSFDRQVRLLAEGDGASMQVRTAPLDIEVGPENLGAARKLTDNLVNVAGQVKQVRPPKQVTLGGLPGWLYIYTFKDAATQQTGAHAHYFLFRGETMMTIVFQVLPSDRFAELVPLFDRIGNTLRPERVSAPPVPGRAPG